MKGYISPRLEGVLRDPGARMELQRSLIGEGNGTIKLAGRIFRVTKLGRGIGRSPNGSASNGTMDNGGK